MTVTIKYISGSSKKNSSNLIIFSDEKFNNSGLKKYVSKTEYLFISDLIKTKDLKKKIIYFDISSKRKVILISLKKNSTSSDLENLGAEFYETFKNFKTNEYNLISDSISNNLKNYIGYFLHGLKLKSYVFEKYKTKKNNKILKINITGKNKPDLKDQLKFEAVEQGTFYTRDLVSEPGNILHPDEYAKRINSLRKFGLKIKIYDEKKLKILLNGYLKDLGKDKINIQWMWRADLDNDGYRCKSFCEKISEIDYSMSKLKKKSVNEIYCFPYSLKFAKLVNKIKNINGLSIYFNPKEKSYKKFLGSQNIGIRPLYAGKLTSKYSFSELINFSLKEKKISKTILSINKIKNFKNFYNFLNV